MSNRSCLRPVDPMDLRVATRIRRRRLELRLESQLLDLGIGESVGTIDKIESGERRVSASQLFRLGVMLGVDVSYFFDEDPERAPPVPDAVDEGDSRTLSEARRFARAYFKVADPAVRQMLSSLVKSIAEDGTQSASEWLPEDPSYPKRKRAT